MSDLPPSAAVSQVPTTTWDDGAEDFFDGAPCGYLSTLPDGTIVKVNETFLRWTGYRQEELVGRRRFRDLLTVGCRIYHETHYAPLLRMQGEVQEIAFDVRCADGRQLPALVNSVLAHDADGAPRIVRTTVFNATDRRGYERELLQARRAAEESESRVRVLQQIVAGLAAAPTEAGVADAVVRAPAAAFAASGGAVWLVEPGRDRLVLAACTGGIDDRLRTVALSASWPPAEVVRRRELLQVASPEEGERDFPGLAAVMAARGRQTLLLAPLTTDSAVLGVVAFGFRERRDVSDAELGLLRLLGQQAGQALDRARLYDEARRREARSAFLAATSRALDEVRDVPGRARRLVERVVPEVADWAAVRMTGSPAALAEAGEPPGDAGVLAAPLAEITAGGPPRVVDGPDAPAAGAVSWAALPLVARGRVVGTLALGFAAARGPYGVDLPFLTDLADRVGLALENARLSEQEHRIAQTLQRGLLAGDPPRDPRFAVATHYRPATETLEVGGDWYDAFLITTDKLAVVVGDVVGRGIEAASAMGQLRSAIRALAAAELGPARLVERLDRFVERLPAARMATVAYAEITLSTGDMDYACAGHLPPLLQEPDGAVRFLWGGRSAPLGSRAGRTARGEERVRLAAATRLLLYTDGLIERRNRFLDDGFARLAEEVAGRRGAPLPGLPERLADALAGAGRHDDVCLLCLSYGAALRLDRSIPADPAQIAALRHDLRAWLVANAVGEDGRDAVVLACSEAVANAVEHGYRGRPDGVVTVTAEFDRGTLELRVHDDGSWSAGPEQGNRGRGLAIIRRIMDDVTVRRDGGTTVTMRLGLGEGAA